MGVRKVLEVEVDGDSLIVWEAGKGTRVIYPTERSAEIAAEWLINKANQFHTAKEANSGQEDESMVSIICYGDIPMTEYQFTKDYLRRAKAAGFELREGLTRPTLEYW